MCKGSKNNLPKKSYHRHLTFKIRAFVNKLSKKILPPHFLRKIFTHGPRKSRNQAGRIWKVSGDDEVIFISALGSTVGFFVSWMN